MIRELKTSVNIKNLASLLFSMYTEVDEKAVTDLNKYEELASEHLKNDRVFIYGDYKALFIMRDVTSPVIDRQLWDGVSVYIKPEYRNTPILSKLYSYMFENFNGDIVGFVHSGSLHEKIVNKRHVKLGSLYVLNRRSE